MNRAQIEAKILSIFREEFEIYDPGLDDNLREVHSFDSIDAIELLREIEEMLHDDLTRDEKKQAMEIRTIREVCDYIEALATARQAGDAV
jgi:acyl carrier protein